MSEQLYSFSSPIGKEVVDEIEKLNLSTLQKLHLKLLSHCLEVFKDISVKSNVPFPDDTLLRKWCENEAQKLEDESFSLLLYEQMHSAAEKLKNYAQRTGKYTLKLNLDDLVDLTNLDDQ